MSWIKNRPLKIVLRIQLSITLVVMCVSWLFLDIDSAISALLGGAISVVATAAFGVLVSQHKGYTAAAAVRTALRAEAVKIVLTISLLWGVFKFYEDVKPFVFIGTFILIVLTYSMALLVADKTNDKINSSK